MKGYLSLVLAALLLAIGLAALPATWRDAGRSRRGASLPPPLLRGWRR